MDDTLKILIVDDHPAFVEGLALVVQSVLPENTTYFAHSAEQAEDMLNRYPDIDWILLDINLPDMSGLKLAEKLDTKKVAANIIIITSENSPAMMNTALNYNVDGFLTKDFDRAQLAKCIKTIDSGEVFITPEHRIQLNTYRDFQLRELKIIEENLSDRRRETLQMIAAGYSNQEIADNLNISESTVKTHVSALISLFNADNRTHCVAEARRLNIIL